MSMVEPNDVLAMSAVIAVLTWLGFVTDASRMGKTIPGVVVILSAGAALSNLNITPYSSAVTDFIGQYVVAAAVPLLMIKADLKKIFRESGRVLIAFAGACAGIVVGVLAGFYALQHWHIGAKVAGFYAGAFVGGTISMLAVANALQMPASDVSAATGAAMIPSVLGLMALVAIPNIPIVQRYYRGTKAFETTGATSESLAATQVPQFQLTHISGALALTFVVCLVARLVAGVVTRVAGHDQTQYNILYVTAVTVVVANVCPRLLQKLRGEFELGMIFMYMFFGMIGLGTNVTAFLSNAVSLFFYVLLLLGVGIVISLVLSKLFRLNLPEAVTGLGAAIVGPVATVAVVAGKDWHAMITPAVMVGIFCHIIGNFIGIMVATLLQ